MMTAADLAAKAADLDAADPLAEHTAAFVRDDDVVSYLDGNSLGRPLAALDERFARFIAHDWGSRLIRSWDEGWMRRPFDLGDRIGALVRGIPGARVLDLGCGGGHVAFAAAAAGATVTAYDLSEAMLSAVVAEAGRRVERP